MAFQVKCWGTSVFAPLPPPKKRTGHSRVRGAVSDVEFLKARVCGLFIFSVGLSALG